MLSGTISLVGKSIAKLKLSSILSTLWIPIRLALAHSSENLCNTVALTILCEMHKPITIPPQTNMLHWIASNGLVIDSVWYGIKSISCLLSTFLSRNGARELATLASRYSNPRSLRSIEGFSLIYLPAKG